ncbi:MAG: hypothetical protein ACJAWK_001204, partial [Candidatus Azotimanducaceae bacterium]
TNIGTVYLTRTIFCFLVNVVPLIPFPSSAL